MFNLRESIKNKTNQKERSLKGLLTVYFGIILSVVILLFVAVITIGIIYLVKKTNGLLIALSIVIPSFLVGLIILIVYSFNRVYNIFYSEFYETTRRNYKNVYDEKRVLEKYSGNIEELRELNECIDKIGVYQSNVVLVSKYSNYNHIPLEYFIKELNLVNEKTFKMYIKEIIGASSCYRNAVIEIDFDIKQELTDKMINEFANVTNKLFVKRNILVSLMMNKKGFYVYLPNIDSLSYFKSQIDSLFESLVLVTKQFTGIGLVAPKINAVIYPFTPIHDIFADLRYSIRQDKEINIYIPDKLVKQKSDSLLHSTMNINTMNKIFTEIGAISKTTSNVDQFISRALRIYKQILNYLNFDESGIILYDTDKKAWITKEITTLDNEQEPIFIANKEVRQELILELDKNTDADGSFFFSSRLNVSKGLGRELDHKQINSGFFYVYKDSENNILGVIYIVNKNEKPVLVDSYVRESLLVVSSLSLYAINTYISRALIDDTLVREANLLKVNDLGQYVVNKENYEITSYSSVMKRIAPQIEVGEKCYKALFGFEKPCKNCPLVAKNKTIKEFDKKQYQVSFSINNKASNTAELLLKRINSKEEMTNRYDPETCINSAYTLRERIKALYMNNTKGYVITLAIDNAADIISKEGNEGYSMMLRHFSNDIIKNVLKDDEVYLYKDNTLVLLLPEVGKLDVLDAIESVYPLSKKKYIDDKQDVDFKICYTAIKFPQEFAHSDDLIRHIERTLTGRDAEKVRPDYAFVEENEFTRPASRKDYILQIIDQAVENDKIIVKVQPVVDGVDKHIFASELLIRLPDVDRDAMLNTNEIIRVAAENNKLSLISDKLINFVKDAYKKYGSALFKSNRFNRMTINAEYAYFISPSFVDKLDKILMENAIQRGFLAFEVTEQELADNYDGFNEVVKHLASIGVSIICDKYTGRILSLAKIKELGIKEIKTDNSVCVDINININKLNGLKMIVEQAAINGLKLTVLGIENGEQYALLKQYSQDIYMQGYYFYHPMDLSELVELLKSIISN